MLRLSMVGLSSQPAISGEDTHRVAMMLQTGNQDQLGRELVRRGFIDPVKLVEALRVQKQENRPLAEILLSKGLVSADKLRYAMAGVLNMPVVDLKRQTVDPEVLKYIPEPLARRHRVLPVELKSNILLVAMANPDDL
jgi:type IV pilus assembly protein PilB